MIDAMTTGEKVESVVGRGLIPIIALFLLFLAAIAVVVEHKYPRPIAQAQPQSQAASAAETEDAFAELSLVAKAAIVIDLKNNKTLYALNQDAQLPLASLAKVPLALVVSDALPPDTVITIPRDTAPKGSAERLAKGERWRVQDIIDFTLVASSNEGAEILASAVDESIREKYPNAPENSAAIWRMNALAEQLGLTRTYFLNASGLDISTTLSGAYGSARDIAALFAYAATEHLFIFSKTADDGLLLTSANGKNTTRAFNTNEAQGQIQGIMMGKTGITDLAGGNLAVVFDAGYGHPIVAVVLGSTREGRFSDMRQLVSYARVAVAEQKEVLATGQ
ncbi:MAG: serine hydrolase [bacterium]|nr:serine hydrolase [bacterium]